MARKMKWEFWLAGIIWSKHCWHDAGCNSVKQVDDRKKRGEFDAARRLINWKGLTWLAVCVGGNFHNKTTTDIEFQGKNAQELDIVFLMWELTDQKRKNTLFGTLSAIFTLFGMFASSVCKVSFAFTKGMENFRRIVWTDRGTFKTFIFVHFVLFCPNEFYSIPAYFFDTFILCLVVGTATYMDPTFPLPHSWLPVSHQTRTYLQK